MSEPNLSAFIRSVADLPLAEIDAELKACTEKILQLIGGLSQ